MFARAGIRWSIHLVVLAVVLSPLAPAMLAHGSGLSAGHPASAHAVPASAVHPKALASPSVRAATEQRILSELQSQHVPMKYAYLPNFNAQVSTHGGVVTPTYSHSPAPYGIATYGVRNTTGNASAFILNSPSYEGSITLNSLNEFYLDDDSTDYIGAQLNTVVSNITLFGNTSYSFWNQNVISYSARSNLLQFIDNIWNFSSPAFFLSPNVFNQTSPNGTQVGSTFYYGLGPVINVSMPFTVNLYINASTTNVNGFPDDIVYYNYTVIKSGLSIASGSYDWAIFNSQNPTSPTASIPAPEYQLNGYYPSPTGYLPYESELVFCGPGGGSTTSVLNIGATLNLWYLNMTTGTYQTVPSAVSFGTNTGETIEGATEWFDAAHTVHVGPGPTLPFPLWNSSPTAAPGHLTVTAAITPDTAFVFLNESPKPTTPWNYSWVGWAPVPIGGALSYAMPVGNYSMHIMLSNYDPPTVPYIVGSTPSSWNLGVIAMTANTSRGIYTPLVAFSNSQLAELAVSGAGTLGSPYVLPTNGVASLDPIFGSINDFAFPVFPGLLLAHTTAYVTLNHSTTFHIDFGGRVLTYMQRNGLPTSNDLQIQLYGTSHVSITHMPAISGWFDGANLNGFPFASLMLWNTTSTLIADNVFSSEGTSLLMYGGTGNTVTGNWFNMDPILNTAQGGLLLGGFNAFGPQVYDNGDLLFNNAFLTQIPAYSPASTIYLETFHSTFNSTWNDTWNVSAQPAGDVFVVNGIAFNGSILNGSYVGGNLWWDYASGASSLPFNGRGLVASGGDWLPLVGDLVTVTEVGLPAGTLWSYVFDGILVTTSHAAVTMAFFDGTFAYTVYPVPGYAMTSGAGTITLSAHAAAIAVFFSWIQPVYVLTFTESGLVATTSWSVTANGLTQTGTTNAIAFNATNGTYTWSVSHVAGLFLSPASGTTTINGGNQSVAVVYSAPAAQQFTAAFVETGLPAGTQWSVTVAGTKISSQLDVISLMETNGSYSYSVSNVTGFSASPLSGTATVAGGASNNAVTFTALPVTLAGTFSPTTAQVWVDAAAVTITTPGAFSVKVAPGVHSVVVSASGYLPYNNNVTVAVAGSASLAIALTPVPSSGSTSSGGLTGTNLALLAGVALLALIFLIGMVYFWSRARRPPVMMKPEANASWKEGTAGETPKP